MITKPELDASRAELGAPSAEMVLPSVRHLLEEAIELPILACDEMDLDPDLEPDHDDEPDHAALGPVC